MSPDQPAPAPGPRDSAGPGPAAPQDLGPLELVVELLAQRVAEKVIAHLGGAQPAKAAEYDEDALRGSHVARRLTADVPEDEILALGDRLGKR